MLCCFNFYCLKRHKTRDKAHVRNLGGGFLNLKKYKKNGQRP
jgi:hypothetical protein